MMKKRIVFVLLFAFLLSSFSFMINANNEDWVFTHTDNPPNYYASIYEYKGTDTDIVCPSVYDNKYIVNEINKYVFENRTIDSIVLPEKLKKIRTGAFMNSTLSNITLPETLEIIEGQAFYGTKLNKVVIPPRVLTIEFNAFMGIQNLTIYMEVRTDTNGMILGESWNGSATVIFGSPPIDEYENTANIEVNGTIEPASLDFVTPINSTFLIDSNRDFHSAEFSVENHSSVPIAVTATRLKAAENNTAKIVNHDKYTDEEWRNLNHANTISQIALGLQVLSINGTISNQFKDYNTSWFLSEDLDSNFFIGNINSNQNHETPPQLKMTFDGKYGGLWGEIVKIDYDLVLTFSL